MDLANNFLKIQKIEKREEKTKRERCMVSQILKVKSNRQPQLFSF